MSLTSQHVAEALPVSHREFVFWNASYGDFTLGTFLNTTHGLRLESWRLIPCIPSESMLKSLSKELRTLLSSPRRLKNEERPQNGWVRPGAQLLSTSPSKS